MEFSEFDVPFDWGTVGAIFSDVDVFVTGLPGSSLESTRYLEQRESGVFELLQRTKVSAVEMNPIEATQNSTGSMKGHYRVVSDFGKSAEEVRWNELTDWVEKNWLNKHVVIDLTTLSGGLIFQLYAAIFAHKSVRISATYFVPETYPQVDAEKDELLPVVTRSIKQPHGYSSFANEYIQGKRKHIILLGFDRHRPNKFVEHYQWPIAEVHAMLGTPAFVENGETQAKKSLGPLYLQLEKIEHIHTINPKLPSRFDGEDGVSELLLELTKDADLVDLVPLGPKPTLLGCLVFYWHVLDESQRERVRFLYDFPTTRKQRTKGWRKLWLYRNLKKFSSA